MRELLPAVSLVALAACSTPAGPELMLIDTAQFEVRGVDAAALAAFVRTRPTESDWQRLFRVRVDGVSEDAPAMIGDYRAEAGLVRFTPRFPLAGGLAYRVEFDGGKLGGSTGGWTVERVFAIPEPDAGPVLEVSEVYPSGDALPENLLRFYIHFSGPMVQGASYRHINLLDEKGNSIEQPFLEIAEELWDRSGTRLTLLIDPGRVKNELKPRLEAGAVLLASHRYTLVIDRAWPDAHGRPLARSFHKRFRAIAPDTVQPDPGKWKLTSPRVATTEPLELEFPSRLDHALLGRMIEIVGPDDEFVDGEIEVLAHETRWLFRPSTAWCKGRHHIVIDTELEDPAGNSIRAPFEIDVFGKTAAHLESESTQLVFSPR